MRTIKFHGVELGILDDKAEAAIRAKGESVIFHACMRAAECPPLPPRLAAQVQYRECPGCGHPIVYHPRSLPKTLLLISMCLQCMRDHFRGRPLTSYAPLGMPL